MEAVGFGPFRAIFDDFRLMQGGKSGVWLGQMSIFPTQQQVKRAKIEPKGINPTASYDNCSTDRSESIPQARE